MRWGLIASDATPFPIDPGYAALREAFPREVKKFGFRSVRDMNAVGIPSLGHSVDRRFYKSQEQTFPLVQIGPGIFAYNESTGYDWKLFRANCLKHLDLALKLYSENSGTRPQPEMLELRYIDALPIPDGEKAQSDFYRVLEAETDLGLGRPRLFDKMKGLRQASRGRINIDFDLVGTKSTKFIVDIASARRNTEKIIRVESKVRATGKDVAKLQSRPEFVKKVGAWLETAHSYTSPFFKQLLGQQRLAKYK